MKHKLLVNVAKNPESESVMTCKHVFIREKILRLLFGNKQRITILFPGLSVDEVVISENAKGGM